MKNSDSDQKVKLTDQPLFRIGMIIAIVLVLFIGLQQWFIPKSFGKTGHYRSDNIQEWTEHELQYAAGSDACLTCHSNVKNIFLSGSHEQLNCETCHGPAVKHPNNPMDSKPSIESSREFCGSCHQTLTGRPDTVITQIDLGTHMGFANCSDCHQPHNPGFKFGGAD
ncbi:MAG: hypothetical protein GX750_04280 [Clostridia bacterium]|nr:hypothetical protein [Clostridia bacterium]